jgi:glycolate oxidase
VGNIELLDELRLILGADAVSSGDAINPDDLHDESLHARTVTPLAVLRPSSTTQVQAIALFASRHSIPLTPRGSGTGLSGGATPVNGGLVVSFSRMNQVLRIDEGDHVAVVQPGITLRELDEALRGHGLRYPVYPGELSGSLGGNINTNAGGMRAVRHGVTRQHVLGLELVLMNGTVLRTGGPVVKSSSGYDLSQLVVGSEGTLALVTEITLKLSPLMAHSATVLAPFATLEQVTTVVPAIVGSGIEPAILEYLDVLTMSAVTSSAGLELGVNADVAAKTLAYLVIVLETRTNAQLEADVEALAEQLDAAGALDVYVLPSHSATSLIEAREKAFWNAKAAGAHEILDIVVPRSTVPIFLARAQEIAQAHETFLVGCGHVGDGNVHLSVYQPDDDRRKVLLRELFSFGVSLGGAISGEHGIGMDKQADFLALSDPVSLALQRQIKAVFDPEGLLNPYRLLDERPSP